jgi:single-strand DNA-binding protein
MSSYNYVCLIGRLGKDPEIKVTESGKKVANFSIATSKHYKDSSGNKQENTSWHNIVAWENVAKVIQNYVKKGSLIQIVGELSSRTYTDKQGNKRYLTEVVAQSVVLFGGNQKSSSDEPTQEEPEEESPRKSTKPKEKKEDNFISVQSDDEDDLPF